MIVNLNDFEEYLAYLKKINEKDLTELELWYNDKKLEIDPQDIEDFKFCGLNNSTFLEFQLEEDK